MEPLSRAPARILVIRMRYLGDVLLLQPALRALRTAFPAAQIDVLLNHGTEVALDAPGCVNAHLLWPRTPFLAGLRLLAQVRARRYDWVVDFTGNDRSALVTLLSGAFLRAAYHRPKQPWYAFRNRVYNIRPHHRRNKPHIITQQLELLEACGVPHRGTAVTLSVRLDEAQWAAGFLAPAPGSVRLHAHLASRDMRKSLPPAIARAVLSRVLENPGTTLTLSHGPGIEQTHARACVQGLPSDRVRLAGGLSWTQLLALIDAADLYWGADTAPMHAAAALGKPMLVHFGPSNPAHWRPLHPAAQIHVSPCPCLDQQRWHCPPGAPGRCLETLDAPATASTLIGLLDRALAHKAPK